MYDLQLLTSAGSLGYPTIPLTTDLSGMLGAGELSPDGPKVGVVCFALVYSPFQLFDDQRSLFYFDR